MADVEINGRLAIPEDELTFSVARSGGPGGQHVNKVSTRVTLTFDVDASPSLGDRQKTRLHERLATRIDRRGVLRVVCGRHRSQAANRREVVERFAELLREALKPPRKRVETRVPRGERRRRLEQKRRRADVKKGRGRVSGSTD
jgi:ribosome-associated protein